MNKASFLTLFFKTLSEQNIEYFVFGEYKELPYDTGGSDIDIVVLGNKVEDVYNILRRISAENDVIIASVFRNATALFPRFLHKDWGIQIDLFDGGFFFNGVSYYDVRYLKNYIVEHNGIKVLLSAKGFFVDYFKEIVHNGKSREKYRNAVLDAFSNNRQECEREIFEMYGDEALHLIESNLNLEGLNSIGMSLRNLIREKLKRKNRFTTLKSKCVKYTRLFQEKPGYVIAVLGTDGSGKSTIINSIMPWLGESFHNSVKYNHLRPNLIPSISELIHGRRKNESKEPVVVTEPHSKKQSGLIGSIFRWGYYLTDYTFGYFRVVWLRIIAHSDVFVFDRYYYDYYIDQKRSRTNLPHWIIRCGEFMVPAPDLILCLGGDPEKIYNRKPETSLEEVSRQTKMLREFCDSRSNAVWVDTTFPQEESIAAVKEAIYNMMSKRFGINK